MARRIIAGVLVAAAAGAGALLAAPAGAAEGERHVLLGLDRRERQLNDFLSRVSDPESPAYRRYLSVAALKKRFGAAPATVTAVRRHMAAAGVRTTLAPTGGFLVARMNEAQIRRVFGGGPSQLSREAARASSPVPLSLPAGLRGLVTEVDGLVPRPLEPAARAGAASGYAAHEIELPPRTGRASGCDAGRQVPTSSDLASRFPGSHAFTPNQFRAAFGFNALHRAGYRGQGMRIALFELGAGWVPGDLAAFGRCFGMPTPKVRGIPVGVDSVPSPLAGEATLEATLDLQAIMIAAPRVERIDVLAGGAQTPWAEVLAAGLDERRLGTLPNVISASYGLCESLYQAGAPLQGAASRRLWDHVSRIAGAAGISVLASSGDSGSSACAHNVDKVSAADPDELIALSAPSVGYPASSPVVTGVGGTGMELDKANGIVLQYPWNETDYGVPGTELSGGEVRFTAGGGTGGTSLLYAAPGYQLDAGIRSARRKVPDLAMYADEAPGVPVYCTAYDAATGAGPCAPDPATGSSFRTVGGTSFATPLLAGGVLIANQYARAKGSPPIGFANPLIYDLGTARSPALRDVVQGDNDVLSVGCCGAGRGYDTASGWGSVNVTRFAQEAHRTWSDAERRRARSDRP